MRILLVLLLLLPIRQVWAEMRYGVLTYHNVVEGKVSGQTDTPTVSRSKLIEHFDWLKNNGYTPVSWRQIKEAEAGKGSLPEKPVLLTFDDGYLSFYQTVFPLLQQYRYPAVLAVVTSWLDEKDYVPYGTIKLPRNRFLSWPQIKTLQQSGLVEIASHSDNLHRGQAGNPMGSEFAAALSGYYRNGRYETAEEYRHRIEVDLKTSADKI